jgi:hypothetical protein
VADIPLDEAHNAVNHLLADEVVDVAVSSNEKAHELAEAARALGAHIECIETALRTGTHG